MSRERGSGSIYRRPGCKTWTIQFYRHGRIVREATGMKDYQAARQQLNRRMQEVKTGTYAGPKMERIRVEELAELFLRDYRINRRKSLDDVEARWKLHLEPFFGEVRAVDVSSTLISEYVDERMSQRAANATINRELAALKRMFRLGHYATPSLVARLPLFRHLQENNVRTGFLEDGQFERIVSYCPELWFRGLVECGRTYGWRVSELLNLRTRQVDVTQRTIRLEPGSTKNRDGRTVTMTANVWHLLGALIEGKRPDDHVFTRNNGRPVKIFRTTWRNACVQAGVGQMLCVRCSKPMSEAECPKCHGKRSRYVGLIFHDLRRTAARDLRRAGIAEGVIMQIGGWRTRTVFERYNIISQADISEALGKLERAREKDRSATERSQFDHDSANSSEERDEAKTVNVN